MSADTPDKCQGTKVQIGLRQAALLSMLAKVALGVMTDADMARTGLKKVADQPDDELSDLHSFALAHDNHKGLHEIILEAVISQFVPLQELHRQLAQAVHRIDGDIEILVTADIDKEV